MIPQDRLTYNRLFLKIKQNLNRAVVDDSELQKDYNSLDAMLKKISSKADQEEILFLKLMKRLKNTKITVPQKLAIIDGALLFIPNFLEKHRRENLVVIDIGSKNRYLKMLESAYPEFYNKEMKEYDNEYLENLEGYFLSCDEIIKTFKNKDGYDDFKKNITQFIGVKKKLSANSFSIWSKKLELPEDAITNINSCFDFISKITKTAAEELEKEEEEAKVEEAKVENEKAGKVKKAGKENEKAGKKVSSKRTKYLQITFLIIALIIFTVFFADYFLDLKISNWFKSLIAQKIKI